MANGRHSFVAFYPSDWLAGTRFLPRIHRSVYFDVCCYIWDTGKACPPIMVAGIVSDLPNGQEIIEELIAAEKLVRNDDGSLENAKAMVEAAKASAAHRAKSAGGSAARAAAKSAAILDGKSDGGTDTIEPEPEPEPDTSFRGRALPKDFAPVLTDKAARNAELLGEKQFNIELDKFKDHHTAKGSVMKDWQAAFRTWLSNAVTYQSKGQGNGNRSGKPSGWLKR